MKNFFRYLLKFGLLATLTFLSLFVYYYKNSRKFRKSIIAAFATSTFFFAGLPTANSSGEAEGFTNQPQYQRNIKPGRGIFSSNQNNNGSGPGKPNNNDDSGIPKYPKTESVKETKKRVQSMDEDLRRLRKVRDPDTETESEGECSDESINSNSPDYSEIITFFDGYKAESINSATDHQLIKHGHDWKIDDIDLKNTEDANKSSKAGQYKQVRTRLTPENRNQFRINLREFTSRPDLEVYPNYPINNGMGRAYIDPKTNLFVGIDENGIIRKTYVASPNLARFLRNNCGGENSENK